MTPKPPYPKLDCSRARTVPLTGRKVDETLLIDPGAFDPAAAEIEHLIPSVLKGAELKHLADAWASAVRRGRAVILGMGGHPIKVGLSRLVTDLIDRGMLTAVAGNGATGIHDLEMAFFGQTSEEVAEGLPSGTFGMAEDTGRVYWEAVAGADRDGYGLGQALGHLIVDRQPPHQTLSVLAAAYTRGIPATIHSAIGADIVHMHPAGASTNDPAGALGRASMRDFEVLAQVVVGLDDGGIYLNLGSAVQLPEVFLKAVNLARNVEGRPHRIVTANLDMLQHYRPHQNVVTRPTLPDGTGYSITGHHEILFPLLYAMVRRRLE